MERVKNIETSATTRPPRVLLVTKNLGSLISSSEQEVIRELPAELEISTGGDDRLASAARGRFDAILILVAADEDTSFGVELARRLRRGCDANDRPLIVGLLERAPPVNHARWIAAGMDRVLTRPLDAAALRSALEPSRSASADDDDRESAVLASAALEKLRRLAKSSPELLLQLVAQARHELARRADELRHAVERADASSTRLAAHTLKSIAASVGARRLAELAASYEERALDGDADRSRSLSATFDHALDTTLRALDEFPPGDG